MHTREARKHSIFGGTFTNLSVVVESRITMPRFMIIQNDSEFVQLTAYSVFSTEFEGTSGIVGCYSIPCAQRFCISDIGW